MSERFGVTGPSYLHENVLMLSAHPERNCAPAKLLAGGEHDSDTAVALPPDGATMLERTNEKCTSGRSA